MKKLALLLLVVLPVSLLAFPQATRSDQTPGPATQVITLGNAAVTLAGPWKFEPGDSPWVNGAPAWAEPEFDDSRWTAMDLHSKEGELDSFYGNSGYLTGWAARGFPRLSGFAWYRLRVHVTSATGRLWIKMPDHQDDSYQVYVNRQFVGEFGHFNPKGVECYRSRPLIFELPEPNGHGDVLLAIRFYMEPWVAVMSATGDSGGMHQAPVLGMKPAIELLQTQSENVRVLSQIVSLFIGFLMLVAAVGAIRIYLLDRGQNTYLWLAGAFILGTAQFASVAWSLFTYAYTQDVQGIMQSAIPALAIACWIYFWRGWFGLKRSRWVNFLIVTCVVVMILTSAANLLRGGNLSVYWLAFEIRTTANLILGAMLFLALAQGARRDRAGALAALTPVVLLAVAAFSPELINWFHIRTTWFPFGVGITLGDMALLLMVLVVGALAGRRFLNTQVEQRLERQEVERELEQASELQQRVLVPEPFESEFFQVETEYRPAQTVGGDFFQTLATPHGSMLVVIGDVSGKGVSAAMLVAVLVGAIRARADESFDPATMLRMLNHRLLGRSGGHFATCLAAEISLDGTMRIANAGHLPPYCNGRDMELDGSLPLGLSAEAEYPVRSFALQPGDRLTFMTDGVVEATNSTGELFGFERSQEISGLRPADIAEHAQRFGQEDDITVISAMFVGAAEDSHKRVMAV